MKAKVLVFALLALILTTIHLVEAQQAAKVPRIGYLSSGSPPTTTPEFREAFRQGLRDLGYVEGKNIVIEYRWAEGKLDRLPELAAELVRLKVDIILAPNSGIARAAKKATTTIPIVMANGGNPFGDGLIASSRGRGET